MIKKYLEFINESVDKNREDFNSLGEWVEYLYSTLKDDDLEYIKNIVNRHFNISREDDLSDIPSDIRLANAINILDDNTKNEIESLIKDFFENGIQEKEPTIEYSTDLEPLTESDISMSGKNIFTSFLKCLTALGKKDTQTNFDVCPDDFLLFYHFDNINVEDLKSVFNRFSSLKRYLELISYDMNEVNLYFGVRLSGNFEYGINLDKLYPIGQFKLSAGVIKWILGLDSKSAFNLKKDLVNYSHNDLLVLSKIKSDIKNFSPGFFDKKSSISIKDRILTIGYFGIGNWDNGQLDSGEYENIKQNFNSWIISKKWSDKVQYNVKPNSSWVYLNLKLK
jgi:hypothetical protein